MPNQYNLTNSKIFITGGAGFIANRLATVLADDNQIVLFDNLHNDAFSSSALSKHPNVKLVQGDVRDFEALKAAADRDVTHFIHCAAIAGVDTVMKDPMRVMSVNIKGTFNAVEVAENLPKLEKFVDFSTSEVFGAEAYNVDEFSISPTVSVGEARWTYAISKLAGEFIVHSSHLQSKLPSVTVRPFNIYGPNQVGVGAIHHFVKMAIAGKPLVVHDDGSQIRSWCYIDDFAHGVLLALCSEKSSGRSYNIGNPRSTLTVYNLAREVVRIAQSQSAIEFKKMNFADVGLRIPNISSARNDLNFEPEIELEEGLLKTITWYKAQH
jgi:nucleoside-diphosphate-sugar epimerase